MKIVSDAEAFGWRFLSFVSVIMLVLLLFSNPIYDTDYTPSIVHDTVIVTDTITVHDTVYKWKEYRKVQVDTDNEEINYSPIVE